MCDRVSVRDFKNPNGKEKDKTPQSQNQPETFLNRKSCINVQNFIKSVQHNNTTSY